MPLLYAVEFEVSAAGELEAIDVLLQHVSRWIGADSPSGEPVLRAPGSILVPARLDGAISVPARQASWDVAASTAAFACRVDVRQQLVETDIELITRVTVGNVAGKTTMRVAISREQLGTSISPVGETALFQPGLVGTVTRDPALEIRANGQRLDGRYVTILTRDEGTQLVEAIRGSQRLPVFVIHARNDAARSIARLLPAKVVGLVRVITVNFATSKVLTDQLPHQAVPYGGARLIWGNHEVPGPAFSALDLARLDMDGIRSELISRVAPLSALARGIDSAWRESSRAAQLEAQSILRARVARARAQLDVGAERDALQEQVEKLESEVRDWAQMADEADARAQRAETIAAGAERFERDADYWRNLYLGVRPPSTDASDPWEVIPELKAKTEPDSTFSAIEDATEGRIVFTDAARKSWKSIDYPQPEDMTSKLCALARAADALYGDDALTIGHLDEWIKITFGINVAFKDLTINKSKNLRDFTYEGATYEQTPHVKVRDGVKPNEVGRIHFALDPANRRVIVNHVALKLYGR